MTKKKKRKMKIIKKRKTKKKKKKKKKKTKKVQMIKMLSGISNSLAYRMLREKKIKSKMLLQVHDELIFNVYNDELDKVKKIVNDKMVNAYKLDVPLKVDIEYGRTWYEAKQEELWKKY